MGQGHSNCAVFLGKTLSYSHRGAGKARCSGESARFPPMWSGFDSWTQHHMWVDFVVGSLSDSDGFFSSFPPSRKINPSKFQFDWESKGHWFVSCKIVSCNPHKTMSIYFILFI